MSIAEYLEWYVLYIPHEVYWWGGAAFLMVLLVMALWKGWQGARWALAFLLVEYVALLMYFAVFCRRPTGQHEWILMPLWSYWTISQGVSVLIEESLMNVAVFVPIGFLSGGDTKRMALVEGDDSLPMYIVSHRAAAAYPDAGILRNGRCNPQYPRSVNRLRSGKSH